MKNSSRVNLIVAIIVILAGVLLLVSVTSSIGSLSDSLDQVVCEHKNTDIKILEYTETAHTYETFCKDCGEKVKDAQKGAHDWNEKGVCSLCKYACSHTNADISYVSASTIDHSVISRCYNCYYNSAELEKHSFDGASCTVCNYVCQHVMRKHDNGDYMWRLDEEGVPECWLGCDFAFDYCTVDDLVLYFWTGGARYTWFFFDWQYDFTVDGEVVGNESGLVVCHEDGTPVHRDELVQSGVNYVRLEKEHAEIVKVDPETCTHPEEKCYDTKLLSWRCTSCGANTGKG